MKVNVVIFCLLEQFQLPSIWVRPFYAFPLLREPFPSLSQPMPRHIRRQNQPVNRKDIAN